MAFNMEAEKYKYMIRNSIDPKIRKYNSLISSCNSFISLLNEKSSSISNLKTNILSINNLLCNFKLNGSQFLGYQVTGVASECDIIIQGIGAYGGIVSVIIGVCNSKIIELNNQKWYCQRMYNTLMAASEDGDV